MASTDRRNKYKEQKQFKCTLGCVSIVLRQTWKNVNLSFKTPSKAGCLSQFPDPDLTEQLQLA